MSVEIITSHLQICDASGDPISGAKIKVYDVSTTTFRDVYAAFDLSGSPAANPIICDSAGRHPMRYTATGSYKIVVTTSADVTVYTSDNIDGRVPVGGTGILAIANGGTGASTASGALASLGAPTAAEVAALSAQVAALAGSAASTEKTHIATGTTAQRPASPVDGDFRRNTTIPQWEGYSGAAAAWQKLAIATEVTTEITATIGWVLIAAIDASGPAVDFNASVAASAFNGTYEAIEVRFSDVKPATDDVALWVRIGTGGGPTYQTGASDYQYQGWQVGSGTVAGLGSNGAAQIALNLTGAGAGIGNAAGENISGSFQFDSPEATDFLQARFACSHSGADGNMRSSGGGARYNVAAAITAVRFLWSTGNFSAGRFAIYGLRRA